jgi:hypothetical protein
MDYNLSQDKYDEIFSYYQKGEYNNIESIIAFGDIHGDLVAFKSCLRKAKLINKNDIWIGGNVHVVQVGDVLDRKPRHDDHSDEDSEFLIISFILKLQIDAYLSGGGYHPVIGNHELMNILGIFDYVSSMGMRHFKNFNERKDYFAPGNQFCQYLACGWNVAIKINQCLFCHGGISKSIAMKYSIQEINEKMRSRLYSKNSNLYEAEFQNLFIAENSILWSRTYSGEIQESPKIFDQLKFVLNKYNCKYMILGHTPYSDGIKLKYNGHVICVDTAMSCAFGKKKSNNERIHFIEVIKNKIFIK